MPPRPKPRPAVAQVSASVADEDDLFILNKDRTSKAWDEMNRMSKKVSPKRVSSSSDEDEDSDSPKRKKAKVRSKDNSKAKRGYNQVDQMLVHMSSEASSSEDDDILEVIRTPRLRRGDGTEVRRRSRSKSITPPPELAPHLIQNARNVVRQALARPHRASSPAFEYNNSDEEDLNDISTDTVQLDPELQKIAREVRAGSETRHIYEDEGKDTDTVQIRVKWQPHPLRPQGAERVTVYNIGRNDTFEKLFIAVANASAIPPGYLLVFYRRNRIYKTGTPKGLSLWGEADFTACEKDTHEYLKKQKDIPTPQASSSKAGQNANSVNIDSDYDSEHESSAQQIPGVSQTTDTQAGTESQSESEADDNRFKIICRSTLTGEKDISLNVRPTTKCGAIVKGFITKAKLDPQLYPKVMGGPSPAIPKGKKGNKANNTVKNPQLCIDGDRIDNDTAIGEFDLEDGDLVEVVGL